MNKLEVEAIIMLKSRRCHNPIKGGYIFTYRGKKNYSTYRDISITGYSINSILSNLNINEIERITFKTYGSTTNLIV